MNLVTRQEAATYFLDQTSGSDDDLVGQLITHISRRLALYCGRADWGGQSERTEYFSGGTRFLVPKYAPIVSVSAIYDDESDHAWASTTEIDSDNYFVLTTTHDANNLGIIYADTDGIFTTGHENIKLVYTAGYDAETSIPGDLKTACLLQLEHDHLRRKAGRFMGQDETGLLEEVRFLANKYSRRIFFA